MSYEPRPESMRILQRAWHWIQSVDYAVTIRWVFYRLLQDGTYSKKAGYKHLICLLSKARKMFYGVWRPWTLADDSRGPILLQRKGYYSLYLRGYGFVDESEWLKTIRKELNCPLDKWMTQPIYAEIWFEAAAMQGQFLHYANRYMPLLAFKGDISIPEKWRTAERLANRYKELQKPIHIYYFGDFDEKGLIIPRSAWSDIGSWATGLIMKDQGLSFEEAKSIFTYHRVGINENHITELGIPENPERPGTYQWEALDDAQAEELILQSTELLALNAFKEMEEKEEEIERRFREKLEEEE